ncbi:MAG TPA: DMT family transporter [Bryobacteraceae bacterium]|nr:DMT family transporter [Bryobacteraceae bacterium]
MTATLPLSKQLAPRKWLIYAIFTTAFWGVWGAFIEVPEKAGFPATLGYAVWALTTIPCAVAGMRIAGWALDRDRRSVLLGSGVGLLGAGGQLLLFEALRLGPAYLVFPVISLYPMLTVLLSVILLRERGNRRTWAGIAFAAPALILLSYQPPSAAGSTGSRWLVLCLVVFVMWGIQAYLMKFANRTMRAESIFFYMSATGLLLIPVALAMTSFANPINWGWSGAWAAAGVQILNSIGALCLVYAMRYGKAMIVAPMTAMAPVLTIVISLLWYHAIPGAVLVEGMALAVISIYLMAE